MTLFLRSSWKTRGNYGGCTKKQRPMFGVVVVICGAEQFSFSFAWKNSSTCRCDMNYIWHKKEPQAKLFTAFVTLEVCSSGTASTTRNTLNSNAGDWSICEKKYQYIFHTFHLFFFFCEKKKSTEKKKVITKTATKFRVLCEGIKSIGIIGWQCIFKNKECSITWTLFHINW